MSRGRRIAALWPVAIVVVVLLAGVVHPAPADVRTDDARTFSPPPGAGPVDGPLDRGTTSPGPGWAGVFASADSAPRPTAAPDGHPPSGAGSLVDRLVADGVGVPLGAVLLGYSRHASAEPLANDVRRRVNEQVVAAPGTHIAAIVDAVDVSRSTVRYHLDVLEEAGLVAGETICGKHRYAPAGHDLSTAAALYDEPAREVLDGVARYEPVSVSGLAAAVDRAPSTVSHHLDRLSDAGLLERVRADGQVEVRLLPEARRHVDDLGPDPGEGDRTAGVTVD